MFRGNAQRTGFSPFKGPSQMKVRWATDLKWEVYASPAVGSDGMLYVGSRYAVYALSAHDGHVVWEYDLTKDRWKFLDAGGELAASPALGCNGVLYASTAGGSIGALAAEPDAAQRLLWKFDIQAPNPGNPAPLRSSPLLLADGSLLFCGWVKGFLLALDSKGHSRWGEPQRAYVGTTSSLALSPDGSTAYFGAFDRKLHASLAATGEEKWAVPSGSYIPETPAVGADGTVYFGEWLLKVPATPAVNPQLSFEGRLQAVSPKGKLLWSSPLKERATSSPALAPDGTVCIVTFDGTLYAVRAVDGKPKVCWTADTKARYSSPLVSSDGKVYVGGLDGKLRAYRLADGTLAGEVSVGGRSIYGSPSPGGDGVLYIGGSDGKLYAVE